MIADLDKLPVMFQLLLQRLDLLGEVVCVDFVLLLCFQAPGLLLVQLPLQGPEAHGQRAAVLLRPPLQV